MSSLKITTHAAGLLLSALLLALLVPAAAMAQTQAVYLRAGTVDLTMPDGVVVPMWGYGLEDAGGTLVQPIQVPGPAIEVDPATTTLTVRLRNMLPEPTSLYIPGLIATGEAPVVENTGVIAKDRIVAFATEVPADGGTTTHTYTYSTLRPGTFLYHSGSNPAKQVQMGLYGAMTQLVGPGEAYTGVSFTAEATLLFSEVDPDLHNDIVNAVYGTEARPSAFEYHPRYFLINGQPFTAQRADIELPASGQVLVRMINAGNENHAPATLGDIMTVVSEDAYLKPDSLQFHQYSLFLSPKKRLDVLMDLPANHRFVVYDRMLDTVNNRLEGPGGMMVFLTTGTAVTSCQGDLNQNGVVDGSDYQLFINDPEFGRVNCTPALPCQYDYNADGMVGLRDLVLLRSWAGVCPPPDAMAASFQPTPAPAAAATPTLGSSAPAASAPTAKASGAVSGDLDGDGLVNQADLTLFLDSLDSTCQGCPADLDGDGEVNARDFLLLRRIMVRPAAK